MSIAQQERLGASASHIAADEAPEIPVVKPHPVDIAFSRAIERGGISSHQVRLMPGARRISALKF